MNTELAIDMGELDWTPQERRKARWIVERERARKKIAAKTK